MQWQHVLYRSHVQIEAVRRRTHKGRKVTRATRAGETSVAAHDTLSHAARFSSVRQEQTKVKPESTKAWGRPKQQGGADKEEQNLLVAQLRKAGRPQLSKESMQKLSLQARSKIIATSMPINAAVAFMSAPAPLCTSDTGRRVEKVRHNRLASHKRQVQ